VPVDQPRCSVSSVGASHAHSSCFVMFGMLMFALRLGRQRKRS
jgi:MYXO-CTERM domain-containing protein